MNERTFAGASHAGYYSQYARWDIDTYVLQVVHFSICDGELTLCRAKTVFERHRLLHMPCCQGIGVEEVIKAAFVDNRTATTSGVGANIDNMIGDFDDIGVVFNYKNGIPLVTQLLQQFV